MQGMTGAYHVLAVGGKGTAGHVSISTNDRNHAVAARDSPLPTHAFGDLRAFLGSSESLPL